MISKASDNGMRNGLAGRSPLWATVSITWINNLGASTALIGVYFVARQAYQFTPSQSLLMGLVQGVLYIAAAMVAGPGTRLLAGPGKAISTRVLLGLMHVALFAVCLLPVLWRSPWSIWLVVALYSPLTGWLWPTIESFLASGRTGDDLRRSTSSFNLGWASCQVVSFWLIAPFMDKPELALWAIPVMGLSHLVTLPLLRFIEAEPAPHGEAGHAHDPREAVLYKRLLAGHRILLVLSYVVYSSLNPLLPTIMDQLRVEDTWRTPLTSIWMFTRVGMFWLMGAWAGWHGRGATLVWPCVLLVLGLSLSMMAPAWGVLALGLAVFGLGMGAIYASAFYYAMEVGAAGVDAGGKHEALIGCGYSAGPVMGLGATSLVAGGLVAESKLTWATLALVLLLMAVGAWWMRRAVRAPSSEAS